MHDSSSRGSRDCRDSASARSFVDAGSSASSPHYALELRSSDEEHVDFVPTRETAALRGEVSFASAEAQTQRVAELLGDGAVVATVPPLPATMRRRLAEHVDDVLERELDARGAPSPYLAAWSPLAEDAPGRLADQLDRARKVGASGIAIVLGTLARTAAPALSEEDSATLRLYAGVARAQSLALVLDDSDALIAGYTDPIALPQLLGAEPEPPATSGIVLAAEPLDSDTSVETVVAPRSTSDLVDDEPSRPSADVLELVVAQRDERPSMDVERRAPAALQLDLELELDDVVETEADAQPNTPLIVDEPVGPSAEELARQQQEEEAAAALAREAEVREAEAREAARLAAEAEEREHARRAATAAAEKERRRAAQGSVNDFWRGWVQALAAARGPQPLVAFERVFVEAYMPLASAITQGLDDARALRAYDEFRATFERSYADAFATFGVTSRRPRLVMDAYDVVAKQARLHNARVGHVVVVDSMRLDVGAMIRDELAHRAGGVASLTTEQLLFSSLPTTTIRQLETLARGLDALRAPARTADEEPQESLRGRTADTVRRMRVGSRELYKLDSVAATLAQVDAHANPATDVYAMLETAASSAADALLHHIQTLPPRTLLLVMGDHGFTVDRRGRIGQGGASPEEVIVPAYAFLVGDLH